MVAFLFQKTKVTHVYPTKFFVSLLGTCIWLAKEGISFLGSAKFIFHGRNHTQTHLSCIQYNNDIM